MGGDPGRYAQLLIKLYLISRIMSMTISNGFQKVKRKTRNAGKPNNLIPGRNASPLHKGGKSQPQIRDQSFFY